MTAASATPATPTHRVSGALTAADGPVAAALRSALSDDRVRTTATELGLYRRDASNIEGSAGVVCFPTSTDEVRAAVRIAVDHGMPFVARGSGTGLAGGATPLGGALVITLTKMNRILSVDPVNRLAWVEPGVLNLDLTRAVAAHGLHFAPDPSSQQSCSIGGNLANNSGGPHCLADGVTSAHVLAAEVVMPDGDVVVLGSEGGEPDGYDLRGAFVGSEGMCGIATRICVRLTQNPPDVRTMLFDFDTVDEGAQTVSAIIAAGMVPAALEMMDQLCVQAVEAYIHAGLPTDAAALLLVEVAGPVHGVADELERIVAIAREHRCRSVRVAQDEAERALIWKGRKTAFGAVARIKPNYYLHDTVVPRRALPDVLRQVYEIAERHGILVMNVFHAGDGNLHPLILFDANDADELDRAEKFGADILRLCVKVGGVLTGEHGVGIEKRDLMPEMFSEADLAQQMRVKCAFDDQGLLNPGKVFPTLHRCAELGRMHVKGGQLPFADIPRF